METKQNAILYSYFCSNFFDWKGPKHFYTFTEQFWMCFCYLVGHYLLLFVVIFFLKVLKTVLHVCFCCQYCKYFSSLLFNVIIFLLTQNLNCYIVNTSLVSFTFMLTKSCFHLQIRKILGTLKSLIPWN
jgi:hypothetical protein